MSSFCQSSYAKYSCRKRDFFLVKGNGHTSKGWPSPADSPLQWFSSQGYAQFWIPLQTKELLMHMLLWQKKVLPVQGAVERKKTLLLRRESKQIITSWLFYICCYKVNILSQRLFCEYTLYCTNNKTKVYILWCWLM